MNIEKLIRKAKSSKWGRFKLNFILHRFIPFNRPHGLKIVKITENMVVVKIPYWRINQNHLRGIHACCLATAAEYSSGFLLLYKLGMKDYRIIMESLEVSYKYQAKTDCMATFLINDEDFIDQIQTPLQQEGVVFKSCKIEVKDENNNTVCIATTNWQIKNWEKVKTKLN